MIWRCFEKLFTAADDSFCQVDDPVNDLKALLTQRCGMLVCETFSTVVRPYGTCSNTCGGGTRVRAVSCLSSSGYSVALSNCPDAPVQFEACNTQVCPLYSFSAVIHTIYRIKCPNSSSLGFERILTRPEC